MSQLQTTFAYLSIHGLQQIGRTSTKTIFSAIRWIAAFSFALIILIYHLYTVWEYFVDEPLIVDVEMSEKRLPFPAITICSNGAINRDVVANAETFKSIEAIMRSTGKSYATRKKRMRTKRSKLRASLKFHNWSTQKQRRKRAIVCPNGWTADSTNMVCFGFINPARVPYSPNLCDNAAPGFTTTMVVIPPQPSVAPSWYSTGFSNFADMWSRVVVQPNSGLALNNSCSWLGLSRPTTGTPTNGPDWVWTNGVPICTDIFPWGGDQASDPMGTHAYIYYGSDWGIHVGQSTQLSNSGCSVWCATNAGGPGLPDGSSERCNATASSTTTASASQTTTISDTTATSTSSTTGSLASSASTSTSTSTSTYSTTVSLATSTSTSTSTATVAATTTGLAAASCILLDVPQSNGFDSHLEVTYTPTLAAGAAVPVGTVATFSCANYYHLYGVNQTTCVNGAWDTAQQLYPVCMEDALPAYDVASISSMLSADEKKDPLATSAALNSLIPYILSNLSEHDKFALGFQKKDLFKACVFKSSPCDNENDILHYYDMTVGNCFTLNHKYIMQKYATVKSGKQHGLKLQFDAQQHRYLNIATSPAILLTIHDQNDIPFPDLLGMTVSPGFIYDIAITKVIETTVSTVNQPCAQEIPAIYIYRNSSSYQTEGCVRSVLQKNVESQCGCAAPTLPSATQYCGVDKRSCAESTIRILSDAMITKTQSTCPVACTVIHFTKTVTIQYARPNDEILRKYNYTTEYYKTNVILMNLFYSTLTEMRFNERISYSAINLLSDVGSSLGVFAGMSVISCVELAILIYRVLGLALSNFAKPKSK